MHLFLKDQTEEKSISLYCDKSMKNNVGIIPKVKKRGEEFTTNIVVEFDHLLEFIAGIDDRGLGLFDENDDLNPGKTFDIYPGELKRIFKFQRQNTNLIIEIQTSDLRFHDLFKISYEDFKTAVLMVFDFKEYTSEYIDGKKETNGSDSGKVYISELKKSQNRFIRSGKRLRPRGTSGTGPGKRGEDE